MKTCSLACGVLFIFALGGRIGLAATLTWTGSISTDWNNATNWTPQQAPAAGDHVIINSGSVTIPVDGAFAIMDWAGGSISGSLTVASNGVLNVNGSADVGLYGPLTNSGTINWTGAGRWYVYNNNGLPFTGAIYNLAGALFDIQNDQPMYGGNGNEFINNAGTVRKSAGTNTTTLQVAFNNTGTVNVLQGTLVLGLGGSLGGQFTTTNGTAINLAGGNFTENGLPVFSGAGQSQITGGYLTLTTDTIAGLQLNGGNLILTPTFQGGSITNLTLSGSVLISTNTITGTFNWTDGSIGSPGGALTVAGGGLLNVSGSNDKFLYGPLTNSGTINWTGAGRWYVYNNNGLPFTGAIYNLAGALFDIQNDQPMYGGNGNEFINNAGTVRKSVGTNTTILYVALNNSGTVEVDTGILSLQSAYSNTSSANLAFSLGGAAPGSGYGSISFNTPLAMNGTFTASTRNGYLPSPGTGFLVLSFPSSTNSFTCLSGLDLGGGILLQPQFDATDLTLLATAYTTNASRPQLFINQNIGSVVIAWPTGFPGWAIQSTTNLSSPAWTTVSNTCGNQVIVPTSSPRQYFRLHNGN